MSPVKEATRQLAAYFHRNGYVRLQNPGRSGDEGAQRYKKGDEIRLVAWSRTELTQIRRFLKTAGFNPGRPFAKSNQWRQPIYGRDEVARFLELVKGAGDIALPAVKKVRNKRK